MIVNMTKKISEPRAAYVHVPFCRHRCGYCDFTLVAGRDDLIDDYLRALEIELQFFNEQKELDTLFLGGGTPSHLSVEQLARLMDLLFDHFRLAEGYEFSIEANPVDLEPEKIGVLMNAGVNRVSLGVQSFDAEILQLLERDHRAEQVLEVVELLRNRIENIGIDLIFGVPGQTLELWQQTLQAAIDLKPVHFSTYGLTFEKGSSFWSRREKRELIPLPEELEREMYRAAMEMLPAAGFEQYELSNFAGPGFRCRHNEVYWNSEAYFGFGPGAAQYINGRRDINHRSVTTWLKRIFAGESPVGESEELSPEERAREAAVIALRKCEGIDKQQFAQWFDFTLDGLAGHAINRYLQTGLLEETESHLRLTTEGRFLADTVIVDFL
jgi:oxygen-independent coproporphyrinogen-3 oxidase